MILAAKDGKLAWKNFSGVGEWMKKKTTIYGTYEAVSLMARYTKHTRERDVDSYRLRKINGVTMSRTKCSTISLFLSLFSICLSSVWKFVIRLMCHFVKGPHSASEMNGNSTFSSFINEAHSIINTIIPYEHSWAMLPRLNLFGFKMHSE